MENKPIKPIPETLKKDGDNWKVRRTSYVEKPSSDVSARKMIVPTGTDNFDFYQRMLQLGHARSPIEHIDEKDLWYIGKSLLEAVNDARITKFLHKRIDTDNENILKCESKMPEEVAMLSKITKNKKITFNTVVQTLIETSGTITHKKLRRIYKGSMELDKYELAKMIHKKANEIINTYKDSFQDDIPYQATIEAAKYVREQLEDEENRQKEKEQQKQNQTKSEKRISKALEEDSKKDKQKKEISQQQVSKDGAISKAGKYFEEKYQTTEADFVWEQYKTVKCKLTVKVKTNKIGKKERTAFEGRFANPARWVIDRKAFRKRRPLGNAGALLIDSSGSMHLSVEHIERIMKVSPTVTMAKYQCNMTQKDYDNGVKQGHHGKLCILAKGGKRISALELDRYTVGGVNGCDLPALEWLAKQNGPRFWISDCCVAKIHDIDKTSITICHNREWACKGEHTEFFQECLTFCKKNNIHIISKMSKAIKFLETIKRRNYV